MTANVFDRLLLADGRILHHLGLMLTREEQRADTSCTSGVGQRDVARPAEPAVAPLVVCAWCDQEQGVVRSVVGLMSHGICQRHKAEQLAQLDRRVA